MNEARHNPIGRRAFSLVELLMAIVILGLGVIAISSLFPAGIAQQRQASDDIVGPIVANNALALLRSKVQQEDFGTFEEFAVDITVFSGGPMRVQGDWPWLRPAFVYGSSDYANGSIDIFNGTGDATADEFTAGASLIESGIPFNTLKYGNTPPAYVVGQGERGYPMRSDVGPASRDRPQFYWDCMFRRYQGRVQVAIFVYRVTLPPGDRDRYVVAPNPSNPTTPPVPIVLSLGNNPTFCAEGPWDTPLVDPEDATVVYGAEESTDYDAANAAYSWAEPGQWILDQNANIHRVLGQFPKEEGRPLEVELQRPVPLVPNTPVNIFGPTTLFGPPGQFRYAVEDVVTSIYYMPVMDQPGDFNGDGVDDAPRSLTPVFVLVEEL